MGKKVGGWCVRWGGGRGIGGEEGGNMGGRGGRGGRGR